MKCLKNFKITFLSLGLCVFLSGCDKDDNEMKDNNAMGESMFVFQGKEYPMASLGGLENYGAIASEHDGTNLDLILVSNSSLLNGNVDGQNAIAQSQNYLDLEMYSSSNQQLSPGKYIFSDIEPHPVFSFSDGDYDLDIDFEGDGNIIGGEVIVDFADGRYKMSFELIDDSGNTVSGIFDGQLILYNIDPD